MMDGTMMGISALGFLSVIAYFVFIIVVIVLSLKYLSRITKAFESLASSMDKIANK